MISLAASIAIVTHSKISHNLHIDRLKRKAELQLFETDDFILYFEKVLVQAIQFSKKIEKPDFRIDWGGLLLSVEPLIFDNGFLTDYHIEPANSVSYNHDHPANNTNKKATTFRRYVDYLGRGCRSKILTNKDQLADQYDIVRDDLTSLIDKPGWVKQVILSYFRRMANLVSYEALIPQSGLVNPFTFDLIYNGIRYRYEQGDILNLTNDNFNIVVENRSNKRVKGFIFSNSLGVNDDGFSKRSS